jgi:hypothetical protein
LLRFFHRFVFLQVARYGLRKPSVVEAKRRADSDSECSSSTGDGTTSSGGGGVGLYAEARFRTDALLGLDRLAGEQVAMMVAQAEEAAAAAAAISLQTKTKAAAAVSPTTPDTNSGAASAAAKRRNAAEFTPTSLSDNPSEEYFDECDSVSDYDDDDDDEDEDEPGSGVDGVVDKFQLRLLTDVFPVFADLYAQLHEADSSYARVCMSHYRSFARGPPNKPFRDPLGLLHMIQQFLHSEAQYAEESAAARGTGTITTVSSAGASGGF